MIFAIIFTDLKFKNALFYFIDKLIAKCICRTNFFVFVEADFKI